MPKQLGLTLLELLVTISIITLLATLGSPAILQTQKSMQLRGVVESSYFSFLQARAMAITKGTDITVSITKGDSWCFGASDSGQCDCNKADSCLIGSVEQVLATKDYPLIKLTHMTFGKEDIAVFDGVRGLSIGHAGSLIFSNGENQLKLILSNMGRVRICSVVSQFSGYQKC